MDRTTAPPLSRTNAALLVIAPAMLLVASFLVVRIDDQNWEGVLNSFASHRGRSDVGWALVLVGSALLTVPAAAIVDRLGSTRPRMAAFARVAVPLGWSGSVGIAMGGLVMSQMALSPERQAQIDVLTAFTAGGSTVVFLMCVIGALGYVTLAVGLVRSKALPTGAAVLVGLGGLGTLLVMAGPIRELLIAMTAILLLGHVWMLSTDRSRSAREQVLVSTSN